MSPEVIQILVETVGVALIGEVVGIVFFYLRKKNLIVWVERAVKAAEQLFPEPGSGEEKKKYVIKFIREEMKITFLTDEQLEILIEAAVRDINAELEKSKEAESTLLED